MELHDLIRMFSEHQNRQVAMNTAFYSLVAKCEGREMRIKLDTIPEDVGGILVQFDEPNGEVVFKAVNAEEYAAIMESDYHTPQ